MSLKEDLLSKSRIGHQSGATGWIWLICHQFPFFNMWIGIFTSLTPISCLYSRSWLAYLLIKRLNEVAKDNLDWHHDGWIIQKYMNQSCVHLVTQEKFGPPVKREAQILRQILQWILFISFVKKVAGPCRVHNRCRWATDDGSSLLNVDLWQFTCYYFFLSSIHHYSRPKKITMTHQWLSMLFLYKTVRWNCMVSLHCLT